jgi:hypothetical protein
MNRPVLLVPVLTMLGGCGPGAVPLSAFSQGTISLFSSQIGDGVAIETIHFSLMLSSSECLTLSSSVNASLNGIPMKLFRSGGDTPDFEGICDLPEFRVDVPSASVTTPEDARLELSDSSTQIAVVVKNMMAARTLTPRQDMSSLSHGQELVFDWSPSDDTFTMEPLMVLSTAGRNYNLFSNRTGPVIQAMVPNNVPAGSTQLELRVYPLTPLIECGGIARCKVGVTWSKSEATVIAP